MVFITVQHVADIRAAYVHAIGGASAARVLEIET